MHPVFLVIACVTLGAATCRAQECRPYWTALDTSFAGGITHMVTFDSGFGPQIHVQRNWGLPVYPDPVQRWDGQSFIPVGTRLRGGPVEDGLSVLDGCLYYMGRAINGPTQLYRWNTEAWAPVMPPMFLTPFPFVGPTAFPNFYAPEGAIAGIYGYYADPLTIGGPYVVRWTGSFWKRIGKPDHSSLALPLATFTFDGVPNLLVAGPFVSINNTPAPYIARYDGQDWHAVGSPPRTANCFASWDDGNGVSLYMGFAGTGSAGTTQLQREGIARWTGQDWVGVGGGLWGAQSGTGGVGDMAVFDDGTGPALFVLGGFDRAGGPNGIPAWNIAKWDGEQWHPLGAGVGSFGSRLAVADDGRGPSLFVLGVISCGGGVVNRIAQWVGCAGNRQCYADCDNNRQLNANDFMCFMTRFAAKDPYANCDVSTAAPAINAADFVCFINKFAAGCN